ncbi:MAG: hypothetical protein ACO4AI_06590 [Prochlorothrix sp.]|nr:hypothetical protein [Prochlorothrix sp.]
MNPAPPCPTTHWVTLTVPLGATPATTIAQITAATQDQGELLRWAITAVDRSTQTLTIEAVLLI